MTFIIPRRAALILFAVAAFNPLMGSPIQAMLVWWIAGAVCASVVQYYRSRGDHITRARLWYATTPLWVTSLIPLALSATVSWFEKTTAVALLAGTATWAHVRARTHEVMLLAIHGTPRPVFG